MICANSPHHSISHHLRSYGLIYTVMLLVMASMPLLRCFTFYIFCTLSADVLHAQQAAKETRGIKHTVHGNLLREEIEHLLCKGMPTENRLPKSGLTQLFKAHGIESLPEKETWEKSVREFYDQLNHESLAQIRKAIPVYSRSFQIEPVSEDAQPGEVRVTPLGEDVVDFDYEKEFGIPLAAKNALAKAFKDLDASSQAKARTALEQLDQITYSISVKGKRYFGESMKMVKHLPQREIKTLEVFPHDEKTMAVQFTAPCGAQFEVSANWFAHFDKAAKRFVCKPYKVEAKAYIEPFSTQGGQDEEDQPAGEKLNSPALVPILK